MFPGLRPELTRIVEETVVNLKELESRIEVLKTDLCVLCQGVGHPAAAQLAITPVRALSPFAAGVPLGAMSGFASQPSFGTIAPQGPPTFPYGVPSTPVLPAAPSSWSSIVPPFAPGYPNPLHPAQSALIYP